jgi:hypothetical protein
MTESRLKELQTEIAKLKQIDKETIERVVAEFFEIDIAELSCRTGDDTMGSFDENGDALEFISAWTQEDCNEFIDVGCSAELDNEWANESENIQ